jgi:site-specific DNA recombinase
MRAVIYARISSDDGRALGVKRQEKDCRALCDDRGWTVADVLVDNDLSAYSGKPRPGYATLLEGLRVKRWDVLVVWHPDRLHRRPVELEEFIDVVEASGAQVSTVTAGEIDYATPEGRFLARITGSVARKESEDKSRRSARKQLELAEAGAYSGGGSRPFGFEDDGVTVRESEAVEIRAAVDRVLAGSTLRAIVTDWNERVPSVTGGRWDGRGIKRVLSSPRIAGLREHRGHIVGPAQWPAIVDPDVVARVRSTLAANNRQPGARSYLLTGWLYCGACEAKMHAHPRYVNGKTVRRYNCVRDRGGCGGPGINAERAEAFVADMVIDWLARQPLPEPQPEPDRPLEDIEARMVELAEMFAAGEIGRAEWGAARRSLEARRDSLVVEPSPVVYAGRDVRADWAAADLDGRRGILASAVERVLLAPTARGNNRFDPNRLTIEWRPVG